MSHSARQLVSTRRHHMPAVQAGDPSNNKTTPSHPTKPPAHEGNSPGAVYRHAVPKPPGFSLAHVPTVRQPKGEKKARWDPQENPRYKALLEPRETEIGITTDDLDDIVALEVETDAVRQLQKRICKSLNPRRPKTPPSEPQQRQLEDHEDDDEEQKRNQLSEQETRQSPPPPPPEEDHQNQEKTQQVEKQNAMTKPKHNQTARLKPKEMVPDAEGHYHFCPEIDRGVRYNFGKPKLYPNRVMGLPWNQALIGGDAAAEEALSRRKANRRNRKQQERREEEARMAIAKEQAAGWKQLRKEEDAIRKDIEKRQREADKAQRRDAKRMQEEEEKKQHEHPHNNSTQEHHARPDVKTEDNPVADALVVVAHSVQGIPDVNEAVWSIGRMATSSSLFRSSPSDKNVWRESNATVVMVDHIHEEFQLQVTQGDSVLGSTELVPVQLQDGEHTVRLAPRGSISLTILRSRSWSPSAHTEAKEHETPPPGSWLLVRARGAHALLSRDWLGGSDPYCRVTVGENEGKEVFVTPCASSLNPQWPKADSMGAFALAELTGAATLNFCVLDQDLGSDDDELGQVKMTLQTVVQHCSGTTFSVPLQCSELSTDERTKQSEKLGTLLLIFEVVQPGWTEPSTQEAADFQVEQERAATRIQAARRGQLGRRRAKERKGDDAAAPHSDTEQPLDEDDEEQAPTDVEESNTAPPQQQEEEGAGVEQAKQEREKDGTAPTTTDEQPVVDIETEGDGAEQRPTFLHFSLVSASNLPVPADSFKAVSCKLFLPDGRVLLKAPTRQDVSNPRWVCDTTGVVLPSDVTSLCVSLDLVPNDESEPEKTLGTAMLSWSPSRAPEGSQTIQLSSGDDDMNALGPLGEISLLCSALVRDDGSDGEAVVVATVKEGKNLADRDWIGKSDPFVVICDAEGAELWHLPTRSDTHNPEWEASQGTVVVPASVIGNELIFRVFDEDPGEQTELIGRAAFAVADIPATGAETFELNLTPAPGEMDKRVEGLDLGTLCVDMTMYRRK